MGTRARTASLAPVGEASATISVGRAYACALREDGSAVCWGNNEYGQAEPPTDERFTAVSVGDAHLRLARGRLGKLLGATTTRGRPSRLRPSRSSPSAPAAHIPAPCVRTAWPPVGDRWIMTTWLVTTERPWPRRRQESGSPASALATATFAPSAPTARPSAGATTGAAPAEPPHGERFAAVSVSYGDYIPECPRAYRRAM